MLDFSEIWWLLTSENLWPCNVAGSVGLMALDHWKKHQKKQTYCTNSQKCSESILLYWYQILTTFPLNIKDEEDGGTYLITKCRLKKQSPWQQYQTQTLEETVWYSLAQSRIVILLPSEFNLQQLAPHCLLVAKHSFKGQLRREDSLHE